MSEVVLSLKGLETRYGQIYALKGISLDVYEGEIVTLLGSNGAGKSTTLKTIWQRYYKCPSTFNS